MSRLYGAACRLVKYARRPRVSVLSLQGLIVSRGGPGWAGPTISLQASREMIDRAFKPARLQAVVLNINSPGGSPVQSDLVASYIRGKAEQRNVPVIAFVEDMAVSGATGWPALGTGYTRPAAP